MTWKPVNDDSVSVPDEVVDPKLEPTFTDKVATVTASALIVLVVAAVLGGVVGYILTKAA
jgi:hypothetical protein